MQDCLNFLPVILGTDINSYGMARSFHQAYGLKSLALGRKKQYFTDDSAIMDVIITSEFDTEPVFLERIVQIGYELSKLDLPLLLVPCSDVYVELVTKNHAAIKQFFYFNCVDEELRLELENKQDFYAACQKHGLHYPETVIVNRGSYESLELPFGFPIIAKADDSIAYFKTKFANKNKAYTVNSKPELKRILDTVYSAGYKGDMILQDFIPGGMETMYVLNAYVDKSNEVRFTSTARCLLDECLPADIGNYNALVTGDFPEIDAQCKSFLEAINYRGFANFDFKFDHRDGKYKVFELNLRQGRSSFYTTAAGCNLATWLVEDLLGEGCSGYLRHTDEHLWLNVAKKVLREYTPQEMRPLANRLIAEKKFSYTLDYKKDRSLKRRLAFLRRKLSTIHYYPRYCKLD